MKIHFSEVFFMNIRKIVATVLMLVLILSFAGCMPSSNGKTVQTVTDPATADEISYRSYDDSLRGLCEYFADLGYAYKFVESTGDEVGDPVAMKADMIGADEGYKFTYTYSGKTTVLELYSYTDMNSKFYKQAKSEGKLTVSEELDNGTVDVVLSDNGKYLMIYNDEANNAERKEAVIEAFKGFHK